jgi:SAM-dependent methyltransferase
VNTLPPLSLHAWLRFDTIERLLPRDARTLLEIGAGQGSAGALLARRYTYVGLEPDTVSYKTAVRRVGDAGVVVDETAEAFSSGLPFDIVCAFEVLEHLEHEADALATWLRHLAPGGWLLVSVPAGRHRFGPTDVKAGHYRRYDRRDLEHVLRAAGLEGVEILSYGFPLGYALEAGRNVYARRAGVDSSRKERTSESGRWLQPPDWAAQISRVASAPFRYGQRPFSGTSLGTGLVARARKATAPS